MRFIHRRLPALLTSAIALAACGDDSSSAPAADTMTTDQFAGDGTSDTSTADSDDTSNSNDDVTTVDPDTTASDTATPDTSSDTSTAPSPTLASIVLLDPASVDFDDPEPILAVLDLDHFDPAQHLELLSVSALDLELETPPSLATDVVCPPALTCVWLDFAPAPGPGLTTVTIGIDTTRADHPLGLRAPVHTIALDHVGPVPLPDHGRLDGSWSIDFDGDGHFDLLTLSTPDADAPAAATHAAATWHFIDAVPTNPVDGVGLRFAANTERTPRTVGAVPGATGPTTLLDAMLASPKTFHATWLRSSTSPLPTDGFALGIDTYDANTNTWTSNILASGDADDKPVAIVAAPDSALTPVRGAIVVENAFAAAGIPRRTHFQADITSSQRVQLPLSAATIDALVDDRAAVAATVTSKPNTTTGGTVDTLTLSTAIAPNQLPENDNTCGNADHFRVLHQSGTLIDNAFTAAPSTCESAERLSQRIAAHRPTAVHARLDPVRWFALAGEAGTRMSVGLQTRGAVVTRPDNTVRAVWELRMTTRTASVDRAVTLMEGDGTAPPQVSAVVAPFVTPAGSTVRCTHFDVHVSGDTVLGDAVVRVPGPACGIDPTASLALRTRPAATTRPHTVGALEASAQLADSRTCGHYTQQVWATTRKFGCGYRTTTTLGSGGDSELDLEIRDGLAHPVPTPSTAQPFNGALSNGSQTVLSARVFNGTPDGAWVSATLGGVPIMQATTTVGTQTDVPLVANNETETWLARVNRDGTFGGATRVDGDGLVFESFASVDARGRHGYAGFRGQPLAFAPGRKALRVGAVREGSNGELVIDEVGAAAVPETWDTWHILALNGAASPAVLLAGGKAGQVNELAVARPTPDGRGTVTLLAPPQGFEWPASTTASAASDGAWAALNHPAADGSRHLILIGSSGAVDAPAFAVRVDVEAVLDTATTFEATTIAPPAGHGIIPLGFAAEGDGGFAVVLATIDEAGGVTGGVIRPDVVGEPDWDTLGDETASLTCTGGGGYYCHRGLNHWGGRTDRSTATDPRAPRSSVLGDANGDGLTDLVVLPAVGSGDVEASWPQLMQGIGAGNAEIAAALPAEWHTRPMVLQASPVDGAFLVGGSSSRQLSLRFGGPGLQSLSTAPRGGTKVYTLHWSTQSLR